MYARSDILPASPVFENTADSLHGRKDCLSCVMPFIGWYGRLLKQYNATAGARTVPQGRGKIGFPSAPQKGSDYDAGIPAHKPPLVLPRRSGLGAPGFPGPGETAVILCDY